MNYEECAYEGYGPNGVAILIAVLTDNRNRTGAEIRHILTKNNGTMAEPKRPWRGISRKKDCFSSPRRAWTRKRSWKSYSKRGRRTSNPRMNSSRSILRRNAFETVREALEQSEIPTESAELAMLPKSTVKLEGKEAEQMLRLMETLEDNDDVQNVYANFDISEEQMAEASA